MNLWNELNQIICNSNSFQFSEDCWFGKEVKDSNFDKDKRVKYRELWPNICAKALENIKNLKKEIDKEKDERERYALALTKFSDLEEQFELEKNVHNQECHKYDALILELHNQIAKQAEEIRRLWTENLTIESDSIDLKLDENKHEEDVLETKQRISELEHQLVEELKQHEIELTNQKTKCEFLQSKVDELENKQAAILLDKNECENLKLKIEELEKENVQIYIMILYS
jgi:chromosome segregation ATPase